jgi:programmed cell death 6-interacting protein
VAIAKVPRKVSNPSAFTSECREFGQPLFARLVPFVVHEIASIYGEQRDRLVNLNIIGELEILINKIHNTLKSLDLPRALQALEKPLRLPSRLLPDIEVRQELQRSFTDIAKLKSSDEAIFSEGREILRDEQAEELKYGTERWIATAEELCTQVTEIEGYLRGAINYDELVKRKYQECEDMLKTLSSSNRVDVTPELEAKATKLHIRLNDLTYIESRRRRKIENIRENAKNDDNNGAILDETARLEREYSGTQVTPASFEDFFK